MADVERLIKNRENLDAQLAKSMTSIVFMFTDIKGSTAFYENRGDIEGLAMVNRHNSLLFPVITQNRGKVVKTVGDAIMASFNEGRDALRAAIAMQQALRTDNEGKPAGNQIHIRIGLHSGLALKKNNDWYGDAVNTASRVEHESKPDEIYISDSLAVAARTIGALTSDAGEAELKGKAEKVKLLSVDWRNYAGTLKAAPMWRRYIWMPFAGVFLVGLVLLKALPDAPKPPGGGDGSSAKAVVSDTAATSSITHEELANLLFQDAAIQKILVKNGQLPTREALLDGDLRGLAIGKEGRAQPVTRAEMALLLEDLWIKSTGDSALASKHLDDDKSPFEDVPTEQAAFNAIKNVTEFKWLEPNTPNKFNPGAAVTHDDVQRSLERFLATPQPGK